MKKTGVNVKLNTAATADSVQSEKADAVILATGSKPVVLDIPGAGGRNVSSAIDVLLGQAKIGQNVIVVGGGMIGCETAEYLAKQGKQVTVVEMQERLGADIERTVRWVVLQRLRQAGVKTVTGARVQEIAADHITVHRADIAENIECESVVMAAGLCANDELARALKGKVASLYTVGDCVGPRKIAQATSEALAAACKL